MSLRKFIRRGIGLLGFLWFVSVYAYPIPDSIAVRLQGFVSTLEQFGKALPQEKVYLHFDNTSYYVGDTIWFKAYVTLAEKQVFSSISLQRGARRCMWNY